MTGRERQTEDRLWQQLVEVAGVAGGPTTEARAKEAEMPSELLVTPSARLRPLLPHQSLLGPPTLSLPPASGPLLLPFPPTGMLFLERLPARPLLVPLPNTPRGCRALSLDSYTGW